MNKRILTILIVASVIALGCAAFVWKVLGSRLGAPAPVAATTRVVAASEDIKLGSVLTSSNVTTIEMASVPPGALTKQESAIGRGVVSDIYKGEPILENRLAAVGAGGGLAPTIPPGMRACSVKVDEVVGVSGFATPGMHVDVLASVPLRVVSKSTSEDNTIIKTILQNIQVLSAGVNIEKDKEGKAQQVQVVNLLVTPEQAETLSLISGGANGTKIQLVLRNPLDTASKEVQGDSIGDIFTRTGIVVKKPGKSVVRVVKKPAAKPFEVEVINGSKASKEKFAAPEEKQ
jgi:pilus assembly protein CpaB